MQIKLNSLKKTYSGQAGQINAVDDITLNIPENTIYGIIGKSGAGKSSLVRLISLLETPDSGEVWYNDKRVDNLSKKDLIQQRRQIGMIFQNFNLFTSRTAAKNIAYPLEISGTPKDIIEERVEEMLKLVGLEDRGDAPVSTLSGGQKQRIAIARALATRPDILFCDEATSALDPQTTRQILSLIREIQKKMNLTVVMITHQMEVVRDACDIVAVVENGKVVEKGDVKEIFANPKSTVTKDFISHISSSGISRWSKETGKYILHFAGTKTDDPVISQAAKKFDVDFNIRAGGIQYVKDEEVGVMYTDITGNNEEIEKTIAYLTESGIRVEKAE